MMHHLERPEKVMCKVYFFGPSVPNNRKVNNKNFSAVVCSRGTLSVFTILFTCRLTETGWDGKPKRRMWGYYVCLCVCVCVYMYIYIYIETYIHTYIYLYTHIHICVCLYVYTHTCAHTEAILFSCMIWACNHVFTVWKMSAFACLMLEIGKQGCHSDGSIRFWSLKREKT